MFEWGDIRIFLEVARCRSTLAASKQLGINQTTVSRRISALEQGEAEVAFRAADTVTGDDLVVRKLGMITWAVYCSRAMARNSGVPRSFDEMADKPVVNYTHDVVSKVEIIQEFTQRLSKQQVIATYRTLSTVSVSLCQMNGFGFLPVVVGETRPDLVYCFREEAMQMPLWLVSSREAFGSPTVRDFLKFTGEFGLKDGLTLI